MADYYCENGIVYEVPDNSCFVCAYCSDTFYDSQGPYMCFCGIGKDVSDGYNGDCPEFEERK